MISRQVVQLGISIALARLLSPADFGTIALLALFVGVGQIISEAGLAMALVRTQDATLTDESTVFWCNLGLGIAMGAVLWLAGPVIAAIFHKPVLEPLAHALGFTLAVSAGGSIQQALFTRALNFRPLVIISLIAVILSGAVTIWMAAAGYGVWALAAQTVTATGITTLLLWLSSPWRPALVFSPRSAYRLFGFGGYMMASGLIDVIYTRLYTILVGKLYGVRELGFYARGETTSNLPGALVNSIIGRIAFPLFARLESDPPRIRATMSLLLRGIMLVHAPIMIGLAAVARPTVLVLFGEKWLPAVPFLVALSLAGLLLPMHVLNLRVLMALGRSNLFFRVELVKKTLGIVVVLIGARFGAIGVAWGTAVASVLAYFANAYYVDRLLSYGALAQIRDIGPLIGLATAMAVSVLALETQLGAWSALSRLGLEVAVGVFVYSGLVVLFRPEPVMRLLTLSIDFFSRPQTRSGVE